jgi:hypothetical protein
MPRLSSLRIAIAVFLFVVIAEIACILFLNSGHFVYTLDDPYIHLALAEHIARGHYGINAAEYSAPSSSILWPFLLAPLMRTPFGEFAPLAINFFASLLTLSVLTALVEKTFPDSAYGPGRASRLRGLVIVLMVLGSNLVGLIFTGMEHSLQLLATLTLLQGIISPAGPGETGHFGTRRGFALGAAVVAGPLIRYENLAVSAAALAFLFLQGRRKTAAALAVAMLVPIAAFSGYLHALGLGFVPTSVLAKSNLATAGGTARKLVANVYRNLQNPMGTLEALAMIALVSFAMLGKLPARERRWAGCVAAAAALHLAAGQFGWFNRYEISSYLFAAVSLLYLSRHWLARRVALGGLLPVSAVMVMAALVFSHPYVAGLFQIPLASNNIHEQQFQMHRFAFEFYRRPVAVMDLGYVAFRNRNYVLDINGLASREALGHLAQHDAPDWMDEMARKKSVDWAMVYDRPGLGVPGNWKRLGVLHLGRRCITPAMSEVSFYALNDSAFAQIRPLIPAFRESLPKGVVFDRL